MAIDSDSLQTVKQRGIPGASGALKIASGALKIASGALKIMFTWLSVAVTRPGGPA